MGRKRYRLQFKFWIDTSQPDGELVADTIELLKNDRAFTRAVRDGIMIVSELRQGRVDLLLKLYPWLADALRATPAANPSSGGDDDSDLKASIQRLEQLFLQQNSGPIMAPASGPKAMNVPKIAASVAHDDDEDMLVIKKAKGNGSASENFLKSAFAVAGIQQ